MEKDCKICGKLFSERGLHGHILKTHDVSLPEYYEKFFPRYDKYTGEPIKYEDFLEYFERDFDTDANMVAWLKKASEKDAKDYLIHCLLRRMEAKELKFAPSCIEVETTKGMPPFKAYRHFFGSYKAACEVAKVAFLLDDTISVDKNVKIKGQILIDTREQQPLKFKNSKSQKLAFGDYTLSGDDYNYTYVDRKSESDFKSTVTQGNERFLREIARVKEMDSYLYVVVESSPKDIEANNGVTTHKSNLNYVWASMRRIQHLYPDNVQFIFTGSREKSEQLIPYLLTYGDKLWKADVQSLLNSSGK